MNERIRELTNQMFSMEQFEYAEEFLNDEFIEQFAELIVRECVSINRQRMFLNYEGDSLRVAHNNALLCATSDMFEHFGVK